MGRISDEAKEEVVSRYLLGESTVTLAREYGMSGPGINYILKIRGIACRAVGERPIRSDATMHHLDTNSLALMVEQGMSIREIGRVMKVSPSVVFNTCKSLQIPLRERIAQSVSKRSQQIPTSLFAAPLQADESWLLGLLMADGCVKDNGSITLELIDEEAVMHAKQIIGFGNIRIVEPRGNTKQRMYHYQVNSRNLANRLEMFGLLPRKTKTMQLPDLSLLQLPDFIRGLWDGDGCWSVDKRDGSLIASFGCASETFIRSLHAITSNASGSTSNVRKHSHKVFWHISYQGKSAKKLAKWLYYDASLACLKRKHSTVSSFL